MPVEKINIEKFIELSEQHFLIDVRSPAEYNHAHIPGAYNLPLFTDEERKIVGTAYKQQSREAAIKIGLDFFGPKMRKIVEEVERIIDNRQQTIGSEKNSMNDTNHLPVANCLLLYCWRGGMRSAGVAWLLDLYGFRVCTLAGGYKKFRNYVLDTCKLPFQFNILGGYTGSGKTEMLKALQRQGEAVVDLEEIAGHKGSAFGNIGIEKQPSQEMFENLLVMQIRRAGRNNQMSEFVISHQLSVIWLEDESQRIGDLNIPTELWKTMRNSPVYFLDISFEERLNHIVAQYGTLSKEGLIHAIIRIQRRLGGLETKNAVSFLLDDNTKECFRILLKYYDKWYLKSLHNRENVNSLLINVPCEGVGLHNTRVLRQQALIS